MANRVLLGNVKGDTGAKGEQGTKGDTGANGLTPYIKNGNWWIGTSDTNVTASGNQWFTGNIAPTTEGRNGDLYIDTSNGNVYQKENNIWELKINIKGEKGDTGDKGDKGDTALTVTIGDTTTGEPDTKAKVENIGTNTDLILKFTIPKGEKGDTGARGMQGERGFVGEKGEKGDTGAKGEPGKDGSIITVDGEVVDSIEFTSDPQTQIDTLSSRIAGQEKSFAFDKYSNFILWLNYNYTRLDGRTVDDLVIGSDILIEENNIPDYWCSSIIKPFTSANFTPYESKQNYIRFDTDSQNLTETQKGNARINIGALGISDVKASKLILKYDIETTSYNTAENREILDNYIATTNKSILLLQDDTNLQKYYVLKEIKGNIFYFINDFNKNGTNREISLSYINGQIIKGVIEDNYLNTSFAEFTLTSSSWSNNSQSIDISSIAGDRTNIIVSNSNTGTNEEVLANSKAIANANIYKITYDETTKILTLMCENTPTTDIKIQVGVQI